MNKELMRSARFATEMERVDAGKCAFCAVAMVDQVYRDQCSADEAEISGLCQVCQDRVFEAASRSPIYKKAFGERIRGREELSDEEATAIQQALDEDNANG